MIVPKIDKQQATGALRATGSSDPDVLYAKKEELLTESRRMKFLPVFAYIVGGSMCVTIIGAVVGIPIIFFGRAVSKTIKGNVAAADSALADYLKSVGASARRATA